MFFFVLKSIDLFWTFSGDICVSGFGGLRVSTCMWLFLVVLMSGV